MGDKDLVSKRLLKQIAIDMARIILGLNIDYSEILETEQQRIEERRADLILKTQFNGQPQLIHLEIQNDNQAMMPWRMLRYRTDIQLAYPDLPIMQYLLYIGRPRLTMPTAIIEAELNYRYTSIDIHSIDYEALLRQDTPQALVIAILADFKDNSARQVIHDILHRLLELTGDNQAEFRDYLMMLEILASNRNLNELLQEEETMLNQVKYSDLPSYKIGMKQGLEKGLELGLEKGEVKILLKQLQIKFGPLSDDLRHQIENADTNDLEVYAERILTATNIAEVLQAPMQS